MSYLSTVLYTSILLTFRRRCVDRRRGKLNFLPQSRDDRVEHLFDHRPAGVAIPTRRGNDAVVGDLFL